MILWVAGDHYLAPAFADDVAFGDRICRVIGAFGVKIGADRADQLLDCRFVENGHEIYTTQSRYQFGSFTLGHERAAFAFQEICLPV